MAVSCAHRGHGVSVGDVRGLDSRGAVGVGAVAELVDVVLAPPVHVAVAGERERKVVAERKLTHHDVLQALHAHGRGLGLNGRPVATRAVRAVPPALDRAPGEQRAREPGAIKTLARLHRGDVRREVGDLDRHRPIGGGAVAELAMRVVAPAPRRAVGIVVMVVVAAVDHGARVQVADRDAGDVALRQPQHAHGRRPRVGGGPVTLDSEGEERRRGG